MYHFRTLYYVVLVELLVPSRACEVALFPTTCSLVTTKYNYSIPDLPQLPYISRKKKHYSTAAACSTALHDISSLTKSFPLIIHSHISTDFIFIYVKQL